MVKVNVKWNKSTFEQVEIDSAAGVNALKETIFRLTNVPKDRQKLIAKGAWMGTLKDDADLTKCKLTDCLLVTLMGTADTVEAPSTAVKFIEEMTTEEQAKSGTIGPVGFNNLGNTCYMNATLQCLRYIPDLRQVIASGSPFLQALYRLYNEIDQSGSPVSPMQFVFLLRQNFPQFAQLTRDGRPMQQDADEFLGALIGDAVQSVHDREALESVMGIKLEESLTCSECSEEPAVKHSETVFKLVCNIQGGVNSTQTVDHMHEGIKLGLEGTVEKNSSILGRNAIWNKRQRIAHLPKFLCVQFMRFFWKATPESLDHTGLKCKVLRAVSFPDTFDIFDFCSDDLKEKLQKIRQDDDSSASKKPRVESSESAAAPMEVEDESEEAALQRAVALSMQTPSDSTLPAGFRGLYTLHSVVTHKGRSADSGHYVSYVRMSGDLWHKFDDDKVSETTTEEILKLKGGGDRDMAYVCFYAMKLN